MRTNVRAKLEQVIDIAAELDIFLTIPSNDSIDSGYEDGKYYAIINGKRTESKDLADIKQTIDAAFGVSYSRFN